MHRIDRAVLVLAIVGAAGVATAQEAPRAQDPRPSAPAGAVAPRAAGAAGVAAPAEPFAGVADLPENQAELEALRSGAATFAAPEGAATAAAPVADAAREARRAAFAAVVAEQNGRIAALGARLEAVAGTEESLALQREIEQQKRATGLRLLELQLEQASADGDEAGVAGIEAAIAAWDAPQPAPQPVDRPTPTAPRR